MTRATMATTTISASSYVPRAQTVHILLLGDCTVAASYLPERLKPETRLAEALAARYPHERVLVSNEALDGESVGGLLRRYDRTFARLTPPDYVLIRYGVADRRAYGTEEFRVKLHELVTRIGHDFPRARILLETGIFVDYPAHYEFDRNAILQPIYDVVRDLSRRLKLPLVDIYNRMRRETAEGNWDLRVRGYGVVDEDIPVLGAGQDHLHGHDVRWFTNIHPNPAGVAVIADEEAQVIARYWPDGLRISRKVAGETEHVPGS